MSLCGAIFSLLNGQSIICLSKMHFCCRARDFHVNVSMNSGPKKTKLFSCVFLQKTQTNSSCAKARSHVEWLGSSGRLSHLCVCATQPGVGAFSLGWFSPFHRAGLQVDLEALWQPHGSKAVCRVLQALGNVAICFPLNISTAKIKAPRTPFFCFL